MAVIIPLLSLGGGGGGSWHGGKPYKLCLGENFSGGLNVGLKRLGRTFLGLISSQIAVYTYLHCTSEFLNILCQNAFFMLHFGLWS